MMKIRRKWFEICVETGNGEQKCWSKFVKYFKSEYLLDALAEMLQENVIACKMLSYWTQFSKNGVKRSATVLCVRSHYPRQWWIKLGVQFWTIAINLHIFLVHWEINSLPLAIGIQSQTPKLQSSWKRACATVIETMFGIGTVNKNLVNILVAVKT